MITTEIGTLFELSAEELARAAAERAANARRQAAIVDAEDAFLAAHPEDEDGIPSREDWQDWRLEVVTELSVLGQIVANLCAEIDELAISLAMMRCELAEARAELARLRLASSTGSQPVATGRGPSTREVAQ
jgi:hypothetical protein